MSDEERAAQDAGGAAGVPVPAGLDDGNGGEIDGDFAAITDPALASRLETIHRTMSTLGMRIDALVTSTTSYRSALTDRLTEYADLVTKLTRSQASDLEEYRRANERTLADLRRGLSTSEETLERVGARIDSMLTDAESADDSSRRALAEVRSILESQENLGRFLTESLDQFGEQVLSRLEASEQAAAQQLEALRSAVTEVDATPDPTLGIVDDRLAGIEDRLAVVASNDTAAAMGSRFDTLHSALEDLDRNVRAGLEGAGDTTAIVERLERMERELSSAGQVSTESFGELAGLRAKVDAVLETTANESGAVTGVLDQLKETLQDLASGEVVGALWDEVRQVRATVEALVDRDEHTVDPGAVESLRAEVTELTGSVRDLLEQAEVVDEDGVAPSDGGPLAALAGDVAALRHELSEGLVVEPSDAFGSSVDELRTDLAAIGDKLRAVEDLQATVDALQSAPAPEPVVASLPDGLLDELQGVVASLQEASVSPSPEPVVAELPDGVLAELRAVVHDLRAAAEDEPAATSSELTDEVEAELRAVRTGVEAIIARLDEGLVLATEDGEAPPADASPELVDQVATLRDQVNVEFERVRQLLDSVGGDVDLTPLTARLDRLHDELAERGFEGEAGAASAPTGETYATIDPDVVDLLREEIRNAGAVSDELVETLSTELKALRRRIRLRAEGEIFSDEQLEIIAAAVAEKLAE